MSWLGVNFEAVQNQAEKLLIQSAQLPTSEELTHVDGHSTEAAEATFYAWLARNASTLADSVTGIQTVITEHSDALKAAAQRLVASDDLSALTAGMLEHAIDVAAAPSAASAPPPPAGAAQTDGSAVASAWVDGS
ncbi:MAG: hypothetical protein CMH36_03875 [Microbacterium sp.]|uniref:Uncharacterized protein n=1 Tax=Microbacterium ginsengisoli TaxID=400772 RepID=A0A3C1KFD2_9MICO|nr:hypothetical protein [Microbacterium sp. 4NA327F11]MAL05963.1 hypothetical protein [Microbacterium sp.]MCK9913133.1 hypothetical protein [Microbacteriaceae bacterium K1510]HAN25389.1 hypothetical protein [Microbacterium ginsengisoli]